MVHIPSSGKRGASTNAAVGLSDVGVEGRTSWKVMEVHRRSWKVMEPDGRFGLSDQI